MTHPSNYFNKTIVPESSAGGYALISWLDYKNWSLIHSTKAGLLTQGYGDDPTNGSGRNLYFVSDGYSLNFPAGPLGGMPSNPPYDLIGSGSSSELQIVVRDFSLTEIEASSAQYNSVPYPNQNAWYYVLPPAFSGVNFLSSENFSYNNHLMSYGAVSLGSSRFVFTGGYQLCQFFDYSNFPAFVDWIFGSTPPSGPVNAFGMSYPPDPSTISPTDTLIPGWNPPALNVRHLLLNYLFNLPQGNFIKGK